MATHGSVTIMSELLIKHGIKECLGGLFHPSAIRRELHDGIALLLQPLERDLEEIGVSHNLLDSEPLTDIPDGLLHLQDGSPPGLIASWLLPEPQRLHMEV